MPDIKSPFELPIGIQDQKQKELNKIPEDDRDDLAGLPKLPDECFMARKHIRDIISELIKELKALPKICKRREQVSKELQGYRKDLRQLGRGEWYRRKD